MFVSMVLQTLFINKFHDNSILK